MFKYKSFLRVILPQRQKALISTSRHIKQLFDGTLMLHDYDGKAAEALAMMRAPSKMTKTGMPEGLCTA
ncbi:hypothetical protein AUM59_15125 [Cronobacter sakazakii]|jgi:hypothetical protein|nr:hypothetical protein [Escherichia coli]EFN8571413.1 hypothetical protein [Escherichia coli O85:H32]EGT4387187.1 hypothetical protein [Cronobacter sakazakii]GJL05192.1 hypothetical protein TUM17570_42010 [Enterobacter cloacae]EGT4392322.1 hypothetical protein [Cronobacter sakazakii]